VRAPSGGARQVGASPGPRDLFANDRYAEALLRSLLHAQLGVTLAVLAPAAALLAIYPLLAVLVPRVVTMTLFGLPLTLVILGGAFYPLFVVLGFVYVRLAERTERRFTELLK
jgi:hypothetical protein